jgi:O-acetyl-ADP-ribose deacetylase
MKRTVHNVTIECVQGNIVQQRDMNAVVNAANAQLMPGGGVAGAIHRAAGSGLAEECKALAPIEPGEAVITGGHNLPNAYVIHCLGPVYGRDVPSAELLASCYRNALARAEEKALVSLAFPAISTGVFGYPMEEAAPVALGAVIGEAPKLATVRHVRFVLHDKGALSLHERALERALKEQDGGS